MDNLKTSTLIGSDGFQPTNNAMKFSNLIQKKLISINLWHLIWISVVCSEFFTAIMSIILRGKITYDYLVTGSVVSLIVAALVILIIQHTRKIEKRSKEATFYLDNHTI